MQNNQIWAKSPVELKDNSNIFSDFVISVKKQMLV